jgi:hypothetical protein
VFKRKPKKSHKNDEIFIDYSNDVDVKKVDEDEAKPEHYKALQIDDEVVVSTIQIKEAIQQKVQDEFIEQRKKEAELKQKIIDEQKTKQDANSELLVSKDSVESTIDENLNELDQQETETDEAEEIVEEINELKVQDKVGENEEEILYKREDSTSYEEPLSQEQENLPAEKEASSQDFVYDDEFDTDEEEETEHHPIYPSFLHEELSVRRNLEPINHKPTEEVKEDSVEDYEDDTDEFEEKLVDKSDEETEMNEDDEQYKEEPISEEKKQDLHSYFHPDASVLKKGAKKQRKQKEKDNSEDQRIPLYQYKHHQFYSVREFMDFLESNYILLDDIAQNILKDERFFRWLKEESNQFEESISRMRKFKHDLKQ